VTAAARIQPLRARRSGPLVGRVTAPGDKSISHRSLILGLLAVGETRVRGLLMAEDVLNTAAACRALGAAVEISAAGEARVQGRGIGGLVEPEDVLDFGNSGTGARLMMGVLASHPLLAVATGDASLRRRPMGRVARPLESMGAELRLRAGDRLPGAIRGTGEALPIRYRLPVPSAQVKSAILLAGLNARGETTVIEPEPTRDHSERMLRHFGATVRVEDTAEGRVVTLVGQPELEGRSIDVPADPSSAAFALVAAAIVPGSRVTVAGVGLNPLRTGLLATLEEMGCDLSYGQRREVGGEPVAELTVRHGRLKGTIVPPERAPSMIDEYPILAVAAACAEGKTEMRGLAELRVKESDRLGAVAQGLAACGVKVEEGKDSLVIHGQGKPPAGGASIAARLDHRIAMSFLVLGLASRDPVAIDDIASIATSFPDFVALMRGLGADLAAP